jgi:F0F1-type ATP synthase membrane subunit c/vacuolar-type H+-ATPase subunit K
MRMLQSLSYLTIALHVSGIIITHLPEHKTTVTATSGNRYTALLFVAIVEVLEIYALFISFFVIISSTS